MRIASAAENHLQAPAVTPTTTDAMIFRRLCVRRQDTSLPYNSFNRRIATVRLVVHGLVNVLFVKRSYRR